MSDELMCVWEPRRGETVESALRLDGMGLCIACEDVLVRVGRMCDSCTQIDMDLESRRLAAESEGFRLAGALAMRPAQPRVEMGVVEYEPRLRVALPLLIAGFLALLAVIAVAVWL